MLKFVRKVFSKLGGYVDDLKIRDGAILFWNSGTPLPTILKIDIVKTKFIQCVKEITSDIIQVGAIRSNQESGNIMINSDIYMIDDKCISCDRTPSDEYELVNKKYVDKSTIELIKRIKLLEDTIND